jgi:hypothetical protein
MKTADDLDLGKSLPAGARIIDNAFIQNSVNGFGIGNIIIYKNIKYYIRLDSNKFVVYIGAFDKKFKTEEGVINGETFKELESKIKMKSFVPGYGYEVNLYSGWIALFSNEFILETGKILDTSKVLNIYKPSIIK